jgi:peroxiredoxin-like protein
MKPLPHMYRVRLAGGTGSYGVLSDAGVPELQTAPPADFDGPGDAWSPEQLLLAAVASCFLFTFQAIAKASKLAFTSLEVSGEGIVDRKDGITRFSAIVVRPTLRLPAANDHDRAIRILEKSERGCLVSASLSTPVRLEPEIVVG